MYGVAGCRLKMHEHSGWPDGCYLCLLLCLLFGFKGLLSGISLSNISFTMGALDCQFWLKSQIQNSWEASSPRSIFGRWLRVAEIGGTQGRCAPEVSRSSPKIRTPTYAILLQNLQICALWKSWGILLRSPKASQLLTSWEVSQLSYNPLETSHKKLGQFAH